MARARGETTEACKIEELEQMFKNDVNWKEMQTFPRGCGIVKLESHLGTQGGRNDGTV